MPLILVLALPTPLRRLFDYLPPSALPAEDAAQLQPGTRVLAPFGQQKLVGVVVALRHSSDVPLAKLKPISKILDDAALISSEILRLCHWCAEYYQHPLGEVLHAALPVQLRKPEPLASQTVRSWRHTAKGLGLPQDALKRSPKQQALHQQLLKQSALTDEQLKTLGLNLSVARVMAAKGLLQSIESATPEPECPPPHTPAELPDYQLNHEQLAALKQLRYDRFACYLLEGTTGSGKTEIYLRAIDQVLQAGRQALVLVPEIGLAPQTLARFQRRFAVEVVALHSNVAEQQRSRNWQRARSGQARIVIGTRLSVFTPLPRLGIIIIDEEHDLSFKQQEGLRYSARDLAVMRAFQAQIPLLLGSATPSLESLHNALSGRYQHLQLRQRAGGARAPQMQVVDMRRQPAQQALTDEVVQQLKNTQARGEQALVFINRRGFAPALLCTSCGWTAGCTACDARLTLHSQPRHLRCHHCDSQKPVPPACPNCQAAPLCPVGQGTERSEELLQRLLPQAEILRVDQDSMQSKFAMGKLSEKLNRGDPCILVGTQMLAKGHHFPNLTLVVLLDVDQGLFSGDFRGIERMGQLIVQVSGRAGREGKTGLVLLQTHQPDHPLLHMLLDQGYHPFARRLLAEREAAGMPPVTFMAVMRAESKRPENAIAFLKLALAEARKLQPPSPRHRYLGPVPALMERRQDRFRYQLQFNFNQRAELQQVLKPLLELLEKHALGRRTRWSIDVDPQDMA